MPSLRDRKGDIYLLFRKFTSDFSERYGMGKVTLTNDAIDLLINYRWPGNIRQLKNVAETVTALESERLSRSSERCVVDSATLARYMPKEETSLLPVTASETIGNQMPDSDKQMIIKAIFDLKQEVDRLKARLDSSSSDQAPAPRTAIGPVQEPEEAEWQGLGAPVTHKDIGKVVDISAEEARPQDLSLKRSNREIIVKALEKHGGNRKLAAQEVGISERTLYRWIEKYNLDTKSE